MSDGPEPDKGSAEGPEGARALEQFFACAVDLFVITDHEMRMRRLNPAWEDFLGYPLSDLIGRRYLDFVHPDDRARTVEVAVGLREGAEWIGAFENRFVCRDGSTRWLRWSSVFGRDEGLVYAVGSDVTELKRSEERRRHGDEMLHRGEEMAGLGSWDLDLERGTWRWSRGLFRLIGIDEDQFEEDYEFTLGFVHPEDRANIENQLERVRRGERVATRYRFRRADGEVRVADTTAGLSDPPATHMASGVLIDVTDRVRAEEDAGRLEAELHQSHRLETVGRLAGGVAHDFNNLLTVILNNAALAADELPAGAAGRSELEEVVRAAERGAELTHQLVLFSRQEVVEPEVVDPNQVILQVERLLRRTIGERVELRLSLADDLPPVEINPSQLERVLVNLVVNARDAMPDGGTILLETHPDEAEGEEVARIRVTDDGDGMTGEVAARAFEPFYTTKSAGRGSGLGLATVHGVITQAGGEIGLDSQPGRGTVATVTLASARSAATGEPLRPSAAPAL